MLAVSCRHLPEPEPIYSVCPPSAPVVIDVEEMPDLHFAYKVSPEEASHIYEQHHPNGWVRIMELPAIDNFDEISNWMYKAGIESYYASNVIYYKPK